METSFYTKDRLKDDSCLVMSDTKQSIQPGQYQLQNYFDQKCNIQNETATVAHSQPLLQYKDGYGHGGYSGCAIQADSSLKYGPLITNNKSPQQLCTRLHLTVPYMGRGLGDACTESGLKEGVSTSTRKQCNSLAGIYIDHQYTPLVNCLKTEIQNPVHIVPEDNHTDWIRGGYPSRQWVRNLRN